MHDSSQDELVVGQLRQTSSSLRQASLGLGLKYGVSRYFSECSFIEDRVGLCTFLSAPGGRIGNGIGYNAGGVYGLPKPELCDRTGDADLAFWSLGDDNLRGRRLFMTLTDLREVVTAGF